MMHNVDDASNANESNVVKIALQSKVKNGKGRKVLKHHRNYVIK